VDFGSSILPTQSTLEIGIHLCVFISNIIILNIGTLDLVNIHFKMHLTHYFCQFLGYGKHPFHNAPNSSCSYYNLGYDLCFCQNVLGLSDGLHSCQNALGPDCGLHFCQNVFGLSCSFWNPNYGLHFYHNAHGPICSHQNPSYGLHFYQNAHGPGYGLHFH